MIRIKSDKIIVGEELFSGFVYIDGESIYAVTDEDLPFDEQYDFTGKFVSPGFIDMHTHGAGGFSFLNCTTDEVINGCNFHLKYGMTTIVPTVSAAPPADMEQALECISAAKHSGRVKSNLLGAHLEGPYLSPKQAGAQCPDFITPPNPDFYEPLIQKYGSDLTRWSYAPENDEGGKFCAYLTGHGVIASAGHTDAKYPDMATAIDNGCNLITHLYSCTSTVTRDHGFRSLGVIESAYLRDELFVEIIADGKHLPPDLIRMIIKIKGADRVALITDSLDIAGTSVKEGVMAGVTEYIVEDGVCKLKDRSAFAGSVATANRLIQTLTKECGYSVPFSVKMYTEIPARILSLNKGVLKKGCDADIIAFDDDITVTDIFVMGKRVTA